MRSNICKLTKSMEDFSVIPEEAEKTAIYNNLNQKQATRLRLLTEELICMLPELLEFGSGEFWIENEGTKYELHVALKVENYFNIDRDKVLSVSKSGKNAAATGVKNKIRIAMELMMIGYAEASMYEGVDFYEMGMMSEYMNYNNAWSLNQYKNETNDKKSWDELEKSIIAKLADDVVVGIIGNNVDIVVKKDFA